MTQSISYYLVLGILKLKGVKNDFSQSPINYKKVRKEDVYSPKASLFKNRTVRKASILASEITEILPRKTPQKLLIYIHGGAFIAGPSQHHWDSLKEISTKKEHAIWMCNYPKAPESTIENTSKNIDAIYAKALETYPPESITFLGDSAGGTLILALTQRLIKGKKACPNKIILISPVLDATMSNLAICEIDKKDPMLSKAGVLSAKQMCAGNEALTNPMLSPIYGSFEGFPETILFLAENDITYPDQLLAVEKMEEAKVSLAVITGKNMPHIWPLLPVMKESKIALKRLIDCI